MKFTNLKLLLSVSLAVIFVSGCSERKTEAIGKDLVIKTASEAYLYGLPIVLTDLTRIGSGRPSNQFHHNHRFPDHTFKLVVRPNNDTYYSSAFLDLGKEPQVLSIPDSNDRYYVVPFEDAWTNIFASVGKRTTGTKRQTYVITGPGWSGALPANIPQVKSPTDLVWIIGRTQVNSPEDGTNFVEKFQDGLSLMPLSQWGKDTVSASEQAVEVSYAVEASAAVVSLKKKEINVVQAFKNLSADEYFNYLNELLVKNPGFAADKEILERLAAIGIKPGGKFDATVFDKETQEALKSLPAKIVESLDAAKSGLNTVKEAKPDTRVGHYGADYKKRAYVAYFGLGALGPEEAVYLGYRTDTDNRPLHGDNKYVIHFEPKKTPPAKAFWSITLYDKEGYLAENTIRRYAIGDRSKLKFNKDKSLDIYVQNENPGKAKESNWLPAPKDIFNLSVRIYWPTEEYLKTGNWIKPPIQKLDEKRMPPG